LIIPQIDQNYIYVDGITVLQFYRYKRNITAFLEFQKYRYVGDISSFKTDRKPVVYRKYHKFIQILYWLKQSSLLRVLKTNAE